MQKSALPGGKHGRNTNTSLVFHQELCCGDMVSRLRLRSGRTITYQNGSCTCDPTNCDIQIICFQFENQFWYSTFCKLRIGRERLLYQDLFRLTEDHSVLFQTNREKFDTNICGVYQSQVERADIVSQSMQGVRISV